MQMKLTLPLSSGVNGPFFLTDSSQKSSGVMPFTGSTKT
jgi:hypothetical protein